MSQRNDDGNVSEFDIALISIATAATTLKRLHEKPWWRRSASDRNWMKTQARVISSQADLLCQRRIEQVRASRGLPPRP